MDFPQDFGYCRGRAPGCTNSATMDLKSSTEWPSFHQLQDTPSALQRRTTWVWGLRISRITRSLLRRWWWWWWWWPFFTCARAVLCFQWIQRSGGPVHLLQRAIATLPPRAGEGRSDVAVSEVAETYELSKGRWHLLYFGNGRGRLGRFSLTLWVRTVVNQDSIPKVWFVL